MAVDESLNGHFVKQRMDITECQLPAWCSPFNLSTMYFLVHPHLPREKNWGALWESRESGKSHFSGLLCQQTPYYHTHRLAPKYLSEGKMWAIWDLRGHTGAPAHGWITASSWRCPAHSLGTVLYSSAAAGNQRSSRGVPPRVVSPRTLHALPPCLLSWCCSWTGVIVVLAALVAWTATAPVLSLGAPTWVLLLMTPVPWSSWKAIAEALWGDVC